MKDGVVVASWLSLVVGCCSSLVVGCGRSRVAEPIAPRSGQPVGSPVRPLRKDGLHFSPLEGEDSGVVGMDLCLKCLKHLEAVGQIFAFLGGVIWLK